MRTWGSEIAAVPGTLAHLGRNPSGVGAPFPQRQRALQARQAAPDPPEALACVPTLRLEDLPAGPATVPTTIGHGRPAAAVRSHCADVQMCL